MFIHSLTIHLVTWLKSHIYCLWVSELSLKATRTLSTFPSPCWHLASPAICSCLGVAVCISLFMASNPCLLSYPVNYTEFLRKSKTESTITKHQRHQTSPASSVQSPVGTVFQYIAYLPWFPKSCQLRGCWRSGGGNGVTEHCSMKMAKSQKGFLRLLLSRTSEEAMLWEVWVKQMRMCFPTMVHHSLTMPQSTFLWSGSHWQKEKKKKETPKA